ncbi:MAG: glutamate--tRNA ligase, partial [Bacilli bacterium]|nr:glutamate--tRNA ligase [Bacilli bacterium]
VLSEFAETNDFTLPNDLWFNSVKALAVKHGFAESNKIYKQNPAEYKGHVGDVAEMIRIALVGAKNSPNIHSVLQILGKEETNRRISLANKYLD